ncbi:MULTISPECIES: extracellular solute-binding protein [unclassified Streptomyces]|uniref:extracellular solute-binding protein n=1 Tax=unclassified Streptomyces TaxID=2593676 RepID=UPI00278C3E31|nr:MULTISPECIES: extracellular solute-binding protein [unclassified Streptomyces]
MTSRVTRRSVLAATLAVGAASCTPGTDGSGATSGDTAPGSGGVPDPAKAGNVTLHVWDQETRGGTNAEIEQLNKEFQHRYPNVTIKRVSRSFDDLKTTLKLALSGNNPPDVVQANQGYPDMVAFVEAGLLTPLDNYAGIYEWNTRYPATLLNLNRVTARGASRRFGTGRLYGISQTGEFVGLYYNKAVLKKAGVQPPRTWAEFTDSLAELKKAGELPVQFGNLDKWPAIHTFGMLQDQHGTEQARDTVLGDGDGFATSRTTKAADTLTEWMDRGYLPKDANGLGYDDANKKFMAGQGAYTITGTWMQTDLRKRLGDDLGVMPPPPATRNGKPTTTGGQGLAWSITSRSAHPEVAAAYLDFLTNEHAADVMTENGVLPAVPGKAANALDPDSPDGRMVAAWRQLTSADGLVPYLDYATPTFYDTTSAALQDLIAGKTSSRGFARKLQADYGAFMNKQRGAGSSGAPTS